MIKKPPFVPVLTESEIMDYPSEISQSIAIFRANGLTVKPTNADMPTPPPVQFWESEEIDQYRSLGPILYRESEEIDQYRSLGPILYRESELSN
jgi:hypothetical protein